ncbi:MAG TPA: FAD synthetase family protein [Rectinemataceae bacterium]|nr:FAD synthetase family protein [Rectinemataceae bacterium]
MNVISWQEFVSGAFEDPPIAATVGVFDGLHLGHRDLVSRVLSNSGTRSAVFTFRDNPKRSLRPGAFHGDLFSPEQKLEELERLGVEVCVQIDFSGDFSKLAGRIFLSLLAEKGGIRLLVIGSDFRCGHRLDTGVEEIVSYYAPLGIRTEVLDPVLWGGHPVSSSRIRRSVAEGRLDAAAAMLGRPYELDLRTAIREDSGLGGFTLAGAQVAPPAGMYDVVAAGRGFEESASASFDGRVWMFETPQGRSCEALRLVRLVSRV